jgi:hypothetical protein
MDIKVTVEYEKPSVDRFAALMAQYNEVKAMSAEVIAYYKPLAQAAEAAKLDAILQQLETIFSYAVQLNRLNKYITNIYFTKTGVDHKILEIRVYNGKASAYWETYPLTQKQLAETPNRFTAGYNDSYNILGNWDKWGVYAKLEAECMRLLNVELNKQKEAAEAQVKRLHNITGG